MFFTTYGEKLERQLSDSQMNPGDIVVDVQKENTTPSNSTSDKPTAKAKLHTRPIQDVNMSSRANRFERQIRQTNIANGRCKEPEEYPEAKQSKRSRGGKGKDKTRAARGERYGNIYREETVSEKGGRQRHQERGRVQRTSVKMVLAKVVLNGEDQQI